jgi:hypothetical protein
VARGEAELGIQLISEIVFVPGAELLAPFPAELQAMNVISPDSQYQSRVVGVHVTLNSIIPDLRTRSSHARHANDDLFVALLAFIGDIIDLASRQQRAHLHRLLAARTLRRVCEQARLRRML